MVGRFLDSHASVVVLLENHEHDSNWDWTPINVFMSRFSVRFLRIRSVQKKWMYPLARHVCCNKCFGILVLNVGMCFEHDIR
jgi:hypothetical protein